MLLPCRARFSCGFHCVRLPRFVRFDAPSSIAFCGVARFAALLDFAPPSM
jgi:hypothetical protein